MLPGRDGGDGEGEGGEQRGEAGPRGAGSPAEPLYEGRAPVQHQRRQARILCQGRKVRFLYEILDYFTSSCSHIV